MIAFQFFWLQVADHFRVDKGRLFAVLLVYQRLLPMAVSLAATKPDKCRFIH